VSIRSTDVVVVVVVIIIRMDVMCSDVLLLHVDGLVSCIYKGAEQEEEERGEREFLFFSSYFLHSRQR